MASQSGRWSQVGRPGRILRPRRTRPALTMGAPPFPPSSSSFLCSTNCISTSRHAGQSQAANHSGTVSLVAAHSCHGRHVDAPAAATLYPLVRPLRFPAAAAPSHTPAPRVKDEKPRLCSRLRGWAPSLSSSCTDHVSVRLTCRRLLPIAQAPSDGTNGRMASTFRPSNQATRAGEAIHRTANPPTDPGARPHRDGHDAGIHCQVTWLQLMRPTPRIGPDLVLGCRSYLEGGRFPQKRKRSRERAGWSRIAPIRPERSRITSIKTSRPTCKTLIQSRFIPKNLAFFRPQPPVLSKGGGRCTAGNAALGERGKAARLTTHGSDGTARRAPRDTAATLHDGGEAAHAHARHFKASGASRAAGTSELAPGACRRRGSRGLCAVGGRARDRFSPMDARTHGGSALVDCRFSPRLTRCMWLHWTRCGDGSARISDGVGAGGQRGSGGRPGRDQRNGRLSFRRCSPRAGGVGGERGTGAAGDGG